MENWGGSGGRWECSRGHSGCPSTGAAATRGRCAHHSFHRWRNRPGKVTTRPHGPGVTAGVVQVALWVALTLPLMSLMATWTKIEASSIPSRYTCR